jgi:hypothetical protein
MKTIILTLFTFILVSSVWAEKPKESEHAADPKTTLSVATNYLDTVVVNTLASLELIAATPEAKSGDWNGIKLHLKQLESSLPGVYSFILPNGNYYTLAQDHTNLNLSDRDYFKPLFSGNQVKGFPIYSRSTGKKSVLVAVPIVIDNRVIGALGTSIFLDELHAKLNRDFVLPQNYTWYVLNAEGNTLLHKDSDFIFMNPLMQGSISLREAVSKALKSKSGTMQYKLGRIRHAHYRKLQNIDWWMFLAKIEGAKIETTPQLKLSLERFVPNLQQSLDQIDGSLAKWIEKSKLNVEKENEVRELLSTILDENLNIVEASFVDAKGFLRHIEPRDYKNFENVDISSQEHVIAMRKNPMPLLSSGFTAVEGFLAMVVTHPLYDDGKNFIGSINLLIRPELMIDSLLKKSTVPDNYELWIMQADGMIIYDQDKEELGKMLFNDPTYADYESLLKLGKKIAAAPEGEGSYIFFAPEHKEKVIKNAVWQTVRLHNREWRVVLAYRPYE